MIKKHQIKISNCDYNIIINLRYSEMRAAEGAESEMFHKNNQGNLGFRGAAVHALKLKTLWMGFCVAMDGILPGCSLLQHPIPTVDDNKSHYRMTERAQIMQQKHISRKWHKTKDRILSRWMGG
jgi:hypothetical protein